VAFYPGSRSRSSPRSQRAGIRDQLFFTRPDGTRVEHNGARRFSGNVERSLKAHLLTAAPELEITAQTAHCRWLGETLDYSLVIEAMQFLQDKAALPSATA
jgi:hypothetical protein